MTRRRQPRSDQVLLLEERLKREKNKTHPNLSDDEYFLVRSIDAILKSRHLSYRELEHGITEGHNDGGIDAVYTFLDGALVDEETRKTGRPNARIELEVIQVKNEYGFQETAIQKLIDHLPLLVRPELPADLDVELNAQVRDRFQIFRSLYRSISFPKVSVRIRYITKATDLHVKVEKKADRLCALVANELPGAEVTRHFIGAEDLNREFRKRITTTRKLPVAENLRSPGKGGFVCLVTLHDWHQFISGDDGAILESLFEDNVRDFVGKTRINESIHESLKAGDESSADFWWLNNGVTVLGRQVQRKHDIIEIEDPQIVNGLQTSRIIHQYFHSLGASQRIEGHRRHLLVRVIEAEDETLSSTIIRATNSQNRMDRATLRATDVRQREIEEYFFTRGYYYERRKNHHKNTGVARDKLIEVMDVAQAMGAIYLCEPHTSRGRPSTLVHEPQYSRIFNSKIQLEVYLNSVLIVRRIDNYLAESRHEFDRQHRGNMRFQLARTAVAFALKTSKPRPHELLYLDVENFTDDRLDPIYEWTLKLRKATEGAVRNNDDNALAKSQEWTRRINDELDSFSAKNKWPQHIPSGWG